MQSEFLKDYNKWIINVQDEELKNELQSMKNDMEKIQEAFYKNLEFGTAGIRGVMGAGTNRMNVYVIMQTTKAIAEFLLQGAGQKSVAITYDSRINSQKFAHITASVLASCGIKVYITKQCSPTPFLSFLVKFLSCNMGINITSSHNPKEYNGYKVYNEQGCQIDDDVAKKISDIKQGIDCFKVQYEPFESLVLSGQIEYISQEMEERYLNAVYNESLQKKVDQNLKIVYTALNGVGEPFVTRILNRIGIKDIIYVEEQKHPNGNFTTCPSPNPEKIEAWNYALKYASENNADLLIATDPDSDRLSAIVKDGGDYLHLTGNELGYILIDYILSSLKKQNKLPVKPVVIRSVVTSPLSDEIVKAYNGEIVQTYTGFKNLCGALRKFELQGRKDDVVLCYEESCGYLKGSYVRDKDGVCASMLICELACILKSEGKTIADKLREIKNKYGNYENETIIFRFDGIVNEQRKQNILREMHNKPLESIANDKVVKIVDFSIQNEYNLPKADVIKYILSSGDEVIVRPSGTEPLIKCYITVKNAQNTGKMNALKEYLGKLFALI